VDVPHSLNVWLQTECIEKMHRPLYFFAPEQIQSGVADVSRQAC
jgi:hypothetical protein